MSGTTSRMPRPVGPIIDVARWLDYHAAKLPIGLSLHRAIWQLAGRSLREVAPTQAWANVREEDKKPLETACEHRWYVPGSSPVVYDRRTSPQKALVVEYCDRCFEVRWYREPTP